MALLTCLYMLLMGSPTGRRLLLLLFAASAARMLAIVLVALLAGFHVLFVCATLRVVLCHSLSFQWF
jgi:hypothetical protein